jgi:hypothetical protein
MSKSLKWNVGTFVIPLFFLMNQFCRLQETEKEKKKEIKDSLPGISTN